MSIELEDYRKDLIAAAPELDDTLDALFSEAARSMSPQALKDWLEGARGLSNLGKSPALIVEWMNVMPQVVRECGEDVIRDCVSAVFKLSSMTSGEVLTLMISNLPTAAVRLGDPDMLRAYLQLLHRLSAKAPRGLRPMFGVLEELLSKLTLSGLQRWIDFGAEAYRRDLPRQADYFGLKSDDSRAVLESERRGTLFVDNQRKLNFYLRAFWARDFFLRPAAADFAGFRPFIADRMLHLPDAVDEINGVSGANLYRAMSAHMAAHMVYTLKPEEGEQLSPAQRFFIGFVEDARVEHLAATEFPGMQSLWKALITPGGSAEHEALPLLEKTALAFLDPKEKTGDKELDKLVKSYRKQVDADPKAEKLSRDLGLELFKIFSRRKAVPSLRILESLNIPYRDDNRFLWAAEEFDWESINVGDISRKQVRRNVGLMEFINEIDTETAGDDAQEIWTLSTELFPYEDEGVSYNQMEGKEPISEPFTYPEWDFQTQLLRPAWTTLYERRQGRGDPDSIKDILTANKGVSQRIKQIIDRLRPQGLSRERKLEDGDELDLNAAVDALVMLRVGLQPDPRITMRSVINRRDLAVMILLDLSESTNETVRGTEKTVLELTREASALIATAIEGIGDPFAIHGFSSDGRHDVHYYRFKDFAQHFDDDARSRLAGMKGGLSTRMGAAIRHAGHYLQSRPEKHKLLLVVTDGAPADIDERDPQYLRMDAKKSVEELRRNGITSYCLTLDPHADQYVTRIFGPNGYTIVDRVELLPEKLPVLFASLTQ